MVSENISRKPKPSHDLIEHEKNCVFTINRKCWDGLCPLCKVFNDHYNVSMPPRQGWVACHEIYPPLGEGDIKNYEKHRNGVHTHTLSKYLTRMTFLDSFDTIFKDCRLEITGAQNILGCY